jgi:flagellar motor switch/type III secretory pathway protein FliN
MHASPDHLPYRLLGSSGRSRLQQRLETAVRCWLDTWAQKATVTVAVRLATDDTPLPRVLDPHAEAHHVAANGVAVLDIRFFPRALTAVMGFPTDGLSAAGAPPAKGLAAQLSSAMLRGLVNELMDSASVAKWEFDEGGWRPHGQRTKRSLSQRALVSIGDRDLAELEISPLIVTGLVPLGAPQSKGRVEPRRGAIGKARVKLDAVLGNVELSVSEFLSLDRGDVIVLGTRLGHGCRVEIPEVGGVAEAVVGKRGEHRAVRIRRTEVGRTTG